MKPSHRRFQGTAVAFGRDGDVRLRIPGEDDAWASGLVPGDEVEVELEPRSKPRRARVLRIVREGPGRRTPECELASRCGGCSLAHVDLATTERIKRESIERAVGAAVPVRFVSAPSESGYRRRARLHFEVRRGRVTFGYRPPRSNDLVDVVRCLVLEPRLESAAAAIRAGVLPELEGRGDVRLAIGANGRVVASVRVDRIAPAKAYAAIQALVDDGRLAGAAFFTLGSDRPARFGDPIERTPSDDGSDLEGTIDGFSQANDAVAVAMAKAVRSEADAAGKSVVELYAGHGHLSVGLARDAASFVALEVAAEAGKALERNLAARGLRGRVLIADASAAPRNRTDVVVLDPPRTGAAEAVPAVLAMRPERIVMASCDPRTLERDLTKLVAAGYRVVSATGFDMFPSTPHVEAVVRLEIAEGR